MAHAPGTHLGGIRSVEDVRLRCVMGEGDCWHLRTARGRPQPRGVVQRLWLHGCGEAVSATRAVWELSRAQPMPRGRRAVRVCESYDCVNPEHIKALTHAEAQRRIVGSFEEMTEARRQHLRGLNHGRRKLTAQQVHEIRHSPASAASLARRFGCAATTVTSVRLGRTYRDGVLG